MAPGGPIEEAGATARGLIDALKAQPAVLALSMAQIAMLIFIFYALSKGAEFRDQMLKQQFEFAHKVSDLLARCVVPGKVQQHVQPIAEPGWKPAPEPEGEPK